jgi:hypothetical protein
VALNDDGERSIVSDDDNAITSDLKRTLKERGVSVILPLMDLQDQINIHFADVWAGFTDPIIEASQRYGVQRIVIARASRNSQGMMQVKWQSINNDKSEHWQSNGTNAFSLGLTELVNRTARSFTQDMDHHYSQRYALQISNVKGYADYIRIKDYLLNLTTVSNVELDHLTRNSLEISILLSSNISTLNRTLAIDRVLEEEKTYQSGDVIYYKLAL